MTCHAFRHEDVASLIKIEAYKGREVCKAKAVEVYRNLHRGGYSVRQNGLVVGHTDAVMLKDAEFVVNAAGHKRYLREGVRNVHAWVRGHITESGMGTTAEEAFKLPAVRYDKTRGCFMTHIVTPPHPVKGAMVVALNNRGAFYAYGH
jgi:hypothetical protein